MPDISEGYAAWLPAFEKGQAGVFTQPVNQIVQLLENAFSQVKCFVAPGGGLHRSLLRAGRAGALARAAHSGDPPPLPTPARFPGCCTAAPRTAGPAPPATSLSS